MKPSGSTIEVVPTVDAESDKRSKLSGVRGGTLTGMLRQKRGRAEVDLTTETRKKRPADEPFAVVACPLRSVVGSSTSSLVSIMDVSKASRGSLSSPWVNVIQELPTQASLLLLVIRSLYQEASASPPLKPGLGAPTSESILCAVPVSKVMSCYSSLCRHLLSSTAASGDFSDTLDRLVCSGLVSTTAVKSSQHHLRLQTTPDDVDYALESAGELVRRAQGLVVSVL